MAKKESSSEPLGGLGKVVQIDEAKIKDHLASIVRGTVEETLNSLLDAEADSLCCARKYERKADRKDTRAGHYQRKLETTAGEVTLQVPKLRSLPFETAIIERYRRRETSVEEALIEMYLAGVSVRRVEDITEALWGTRVSSGTVSNLNQKIYATIEKWLSRPIKGEHPYVYLDGMYLKRSWGGEVRNVAVVVAIGVTEEGYREILGVMEGAREDLDSWQRFLKQLKSRGLKGVRLFISDKCLGLVESFGNIYPDARWQRCVVHFYRNVFTMVPRGKTREIAAMLKAIHAQENKAAAEDKIGRVVKKFEEMRLKEAAKIVKEGACETLTYYHFPSEHWIKLRTNNPMERVLKEVRRRTKVVGAFPDGRSALMLVAARLRYVNATKWGTKQYMDIKRLTALEKEGAAAC